MNIFTPQIRSGIRDLRRRLFGGTAGRQRRDFKVLFERFREVLELHNTAADRIADIGEKLSGEYIFDIVYIRQAYEELYRTFSAFLERFSVLTDNCYAELGSRLERIDHDVRQLINEDETPSDDLVVPLVDARMNRLRDVGGKMANLGELGSLPEITIPQGFVITTRSFDEFMSLNRLTDKIADLSVPGEIDPATLAALRSAVCSGALPPGVRDAVTGALAGMVDGTSHQLLAVRSSAVGEDGEYSFAGQFETVLNVPADAASLAEAYKTVIASLFSDRAFHYCKTIGCNPTGIRMAVGVIRMIDAAASGVAYSSDPGGTEGQMLINATWGLGTSVVEGQVDADSYRIARSPQAVMCERRIGAKETMVVPALHGGTTVMKTPDAIVNKAVLDDRALTTLATQALSIEGLFHRPQDIEWAIDRSGAITILQTRPLPLRPAAETGATGAAPAGLPVFQTLSGISVRRGAGAGTVFIAASPDDLDRFPKGGVLVSRHDSSHFIRVMPYASAILTDQGTPTSHMASLCREFRVPTLVNCGSATTVLRNGQEITVMIKEKEAQVYEGILRDLVDGGNNEAIEELYEFRKKKFLLRYILPLHLVDPFRDDFTPNGCSTLHDILRFIHEKMVMKLVSAAEQGLTDRTAVHLDLPVPAGIVAIDLGGGLSLPEHAKTATMDSVSSVPLRAVLAGMTHPGAWHTEVVALHAGDLLAGMMKLADITAPSASMPMTNLAVVSREYLNLSLKFGYHFTLLDCYCSPNRTNNHVYFRFSGGATDLTKRSRRVRLIESILTTFGFVCQIQGAVITARISNRDEDEMIAILNSIGRLLAYTRQLDAVLHNDESVERYTGNFLRGDYRL